MRDLAAWQVDLCWRVRGRWAARRCVPWQRLQRAVTRSRQRLFATARTPWFRGVMVRTRLLWPDTARSRLRLPTALNENIHRPVLACGAVIHLPNRRRQLLPAQAKHRKSRAWSRQGNMRFDSGHRAGARVWSQSALALPEARAHLSRCQNRQKLHQRGHRHLRPQSQGRRQQVPGSFRLRNG